eukprot:scaffold2211_cov65-Phaeocystis_antarctica.AAC.6
MHSRRAGWPVGSAASAGAAGGAPPSSTCCCSCCCSRRASHSSPSSTAARAPACRFNCATRRPTAAESWRPCASAAAGAAGRFTATAAAAAPSAAGAVAATGSSCWRKAATRCRRAVSRRASWRAACSSTASATNSVPPTASSLPPRRRAAGSSAAAATPARRPCRGGRPGRQAPTGCTCTSPLSRFSRSCILDIASETSDEAGAAAPPPRHCLPAPAKARLFGSFSEAWSSARSSSTFRGPRYIRQALTRARRVVHRVQLSRGC